MTFPDDENGQILAEMAEAGLDLSKPYQVDFYAAFEFEDRAKQAADILQPLTFAEHQFSQIAVQAAEEGGGFEIVASLELVLDHTVVSAIDAAFTLEVEKHRGYADGWGVGV